MVAAGEAVLRRLTVRVRITAAVGAVFALALAMGALFLVNRHSHALADDVDTTARLRAADLVAALESGALPSSIAIPVEDESFVQIVDGTGVVRRSSPNIDGEAPIATFVPAAGSIVARTLDEVPVGDTRFRVVARNARVGDESVTVYVGTSLESVTEAVRDLVAGLAVGAPALLVVVTVLTWVAVGRALAPVDRITAEVGSITDRELHRRVPALRQQDEIGRLAQTMNDMLDRLERSAARQRRFVSDASHELRSPLAAIRSQVEVDLAHPAAADWQASEREVLAETLQMQRLVEDLSALARLDEATTPAARDVLDLDDIVLSEARRLRVRGRRDIDAIGVGAVQVIGDADSLRRAVRNLLDNAERHAAGRVTVTLTESATSAALTIADDGSGVPAGLGEQIFERFARGDSARSRTGGTGLGLAIARDIVADHGGTIGLVPSDVGATFVITLPLPS